MRYEIINVKKKQLGITNAQLSEITGITQSTLDKITSGKNQNPTLDTLQAIADAIGCSIDDFRDSHKDALSDNAMRIAALYDTLNEVGQEMLDRASVFASTHFSKSPE